jgi:hypothetical protein
MKKIIFLLTIILVFISTFHVFAEDLCSPTLSTVYFGNGVGRGIATYGEANTSTIKLMSIFMANLDDPNEQQDYEFKLAFNNSSGTITDIIEAARQTLGDNWPTLLVAFLLRDTYILSLLPDSIVQEFNDFLTNRTIQEMIAPTSSIDDVNNHVSSYKSDIGEGKKVILVAHSQGNIFANWSFQRLSSSEQNYFTIVP